MITDITLNDFGKILVAMGIILLVMIPFIWILLTDLQTKCIATAGNTFAGVYAIYVGIVILRGW